MNEYSHTLIIEKDDDEGDIGWYKVTYKVSDGFENSVVMDQGSLATLYNLIGRVLRADHEKENRWTASVQGG